MRVKTRLIKEWIDNDRILKMYNLEKGVYIRIDAKESVCAPKYGLIQKRNTQLNLKITELQVKSIVFRSKKVLEIIF